MSISRVADLAGVSKSTVSRVINNQAGVSPVALQAVRDAMRELEYTPSENRPGPKVGHRAISSGRPKVGFLVLGDAEGSASSAFHDLMRGIASQTDAMNLQLIYSYISDGIPLADQVDLAAFDGLLLCGRQPTPAEQEFIGSRPVVWLMGTRQTVLACDQVIPDFHEIGEVAATYLVGHGHRHLACLNLDQASWPMRVVNESFIARAKAANVSCVEPPPLTDASEVAAWLAARQPTPTGLLIADSDQATVLQPALQAAKVQLGGRGGEIVTCNVHRTYLGSLTPPPAEIGIDVECVGRQGVEQLMWRIEHPSAADRITLCVEPTPPSSAEPR